MSCLFSSTVKKTQFKIGEDKKTQVNTGSEAITSTSALQLPSLLHVIYVLQSNVGFFQVVADIFQDQIS